MSLRRSTRLSVLPNQAPPLTAQAQKPAKPRNGVSKPRTSTRGKKAKQPARGQTSLEDADIPQKTESTTDSAPKKEATSSIWDDTADIQQRQQQQSTPPPLNRPVEPHRTNATLLTPHGSSLVAYPQPSTTEEITTPSKPKPVPRPDLPRPTATTGTLLEQATAHLISTDPRLGPLIEKHPCPLFSAAGLAEEVDPFRSLVSSIIGQQVSGAAAKSIRERFVGLFSRPKSNNGIEPDDYDDGPSRNRFPTPEEIVNMDLPTLRTAGLSQRKAEYIHGLAGKFLSGELSSRMLLDASDAELLEKLTAVRGLGVWSVEMFACFALKRVDVFSTGDLGVQYVFLFLSFSRSGCLSCLSACLAMGLTMSDEDALPS